MSKLSLFAVAVLPVIATPLNAQIPQVVGITKSTPVVMQQLMSTQLRCAQISCKLTFEKQTLAGAGGSAYDSRLGGLWITNGLSLACVDVVTCKFICPPVKMPVPLLGFAKPWCTGLAYVDSGALKSGATAPGWLFASYNTGDIARIDVSKCSLKARFCKATGLPTGYVIGGLATDDVKRLLYVGASNSTGGRIITVAPIDPTLGSATPWCNPTCRLVVPACSSTSTLGPIQGLAHDGCTGMIYVTDGKQTLWGPVTGLGTTRCAITVRGCCPLKVSTAGDTYTGLCLRPTPPTSHGKSCTVPSCNNCSAVMQAALVGDANLGNPAFGLGLRNAPSNSDAAAFALNLGACTSPGVNLSFCQPVLVPLGPTPPLVLLFFGLSAVSGSCNRNRTVPAPLPLTPSLCGQVFSFQWVVRCPPTPAGPGNFGITNCVTARISGS